MAKRARVAIIGTGGTVSFAGRDTLDLYAYIDHGRRQEIGEIVSRFPEIAAHAELELVDYRTISSSGITTDDWLALNRLIHDVANASPPPDGIVVTHGTATLEETAYLLHLTLKTAIPVVLVGAQRPSNALGTDAGMNLLNAVRVAASPDARGMGVLTVLNDEIQSARDVTKTSTFRLQTFKSPDAGPLGIADADGRVVFYRRPFRRHAPDTEFDIRTLHALPRVDISYSYAGADGTAIEAFVAKGARAIVSAGVAPGLPTPAQREALRAAHNAGVTVVYSSRAGGGRVMLRDAMQEDGIIAADNLNPQKARVLIMLGLTREDSTPSALQRMFEVY